jgi:hypothetical protein
MSLSGGGALSRTTTGSGVRGACMPASASAPWSFVSMMTASSAREPKKPTAISATMATP